MMIYIILKLKWLKKKVIFNFKTNIMGDTIKIDLTESVGRDYTTFNQSKLLKELKCNLKSRAYYIHKKENTDKDKVLFEESLLTYSTNSVIDDNSYIAFEQWQIIKWLKLKYDIDIHYTIIGNSGYSFEIFERRINLDKREYHSYQTPERAYSEGFDYILNRLIDKLKHNTNNYIYTDKDMLECFLEGNKYPQESPLIPDFKIGYFYTKFMNKLNKEKNG